MKVIGIAKRPSNPTLTQLYFSDAEKDYGVFTFNHTFSQGEIIDIEYLQGMRRTNKK